MAHLKIDLENDNLLYYSKLLLQLAQVDVMANTAGNDPAYTIDKPTPIKGFDLTDAHLHLTDGEPPLPELAPHEPFNPFAGNVAPLAPPAPPAPSPVAAGVLPTVPVVPTATSIVPPPPPGVPSAPSATSTVPVPAAATQTHAESDEDSEGIRWDARIHSTERGKKIDGTWKLKRGIDKDLAAQVLAELRAASKFPGTVGAPAVPVVPMPPSPAPDFVVPAPPAPVLTPPVPTAAANTPMTYKEFMHWALGEIGAARVSSADINQALLDAQLPTIAQLGAATAVAYLPQAKEAIELKIAANQFK